MNSKLILLAASAVVLTACTSTGSMKSGNDTLSAVVTRNLFGSDRIEVTLNGTVYRGEWKLVPPLNEQTQGETYRHRMHMKTAKQTLKAEDGSTLECQWKIHLYAADGLCVTNGKEYAIGIKQ